MVSCNLKLLPGDQHLCVQPGAPGHSLLQQSGLGVQNIGFFNGNGDRSLLAKKETKVAAFGVSSSILPMENGKELQSFPQAN